MKKILTLMGLCFFATTAKGQETSLTDAIRYAQEDIHGTARFSAMAGAFGSLGGDLSAIGINPAGSAVFTNNQVAFSLASFNKINDADYFSTQTSEVDYSVTINQAGGVYVLMNTNQASDWKKITMALNYDNINHYNNTIYIAGVNPTNSVDNYFLSFANNNGISLGEVSGSNFFITDFAQLQTLFGYNGYVINPESTSPQNNVWISNVPAGGNYFQELSMAQTGYNGKLSFNFATQYKDWLYLGLNLNSHFSDYRQSSSLFERNANDPDDGLQRVRFNNDLLTFGNGFSFSLGAIAKLNESTRVGMAYESPKWLNLEDRFTQSISYVTAENGVNISDFFDPQQIFIYNYRLQTPARLTGSFAYVFGKSGLISVDYSLRNFNNLRFRPEREFLDLNQAMSTALTSSSDIRVGAEKKIKQWSLRAGYRFEQSPYKNNEIMGDLTALSGGLGYNFGEMRADVSYTYTQRKSLTPLISSGLGSGAAVNTMSNQVVLSFVWEL